MLHSIASTDLPRPFSECFSKLPSIFRAACLATHEASKRIEAVLSGVGPTALGFSGGVLGWELGRVSAGGREAEFLGYSHEVS